MDLERIEKETNLAIAYLNHAINATEPRMVMFYLTTAMARIIDALSAILPK